MIYLLKVNAVTIKGIVPLILIHAYTPLAPTAASQKLEEPALTYLNKGTHSMHESPPIVSNL
jgi:hypothetical protein